MHNYSPQHIETLLALLALPGVGPVSALKFARGQPIRQTIRQEALAAATTRTRQNIQEWSDQGITVTGYFDPAYPAPFRELNDPPPVLFSQGNLALLLEENLIAIVGTREPSPAGIKAAAEVVRRLPSGWGVISGLARGIDTVAHRAALEYGYPTIAILGNGIDNPYPGENQALAREILHQGGLILSEQPPGTPPLGHHLVQRDRLQSRLARCVLIAQTGLVGGTLHTARYAAMQSVPILCPPDLDAGPENEGVHALLTRPANTLPELLPAWNNPAPWMKRLSTQAPLAIPLPAHAAHEIESILCAVDPIDDAPPMLF
jgi:DNA processing protein